MKAEITVTEIERRIRMHKGDFEFVNGRGAQAVYAQRQIKNLEECLEMLKSGKTSVEIWAVMTR